MSNQHQKLTPIPPPNQYTVKEIRDRDLPPEAKDLVDKLRDTSLEVAKNV